MVSSKSKTTLKDRPAEQTENVDEEGDGRMFVGSLERGLSVLYAFGGDKRTIGVTEIAEQCGMSRGAAQRMVRTLAQLGYLVRSDGKKQYQLGPKILDFAYMYMRADPVVNVAPPYLMEARQTLGLTVNLSCFDGAHMVYVTRTPGEQTLAPANLVGRRVPTCSSSGGFAVLAHLSDEEVEEIIAKTDFVRVTPHTTADPDAVRSKVAEARAQGYGFGDQEIILGELTVGAAVLNYSGRPVAAVHIPASMPAMTEAEMRERVAPVAISAARAITRALGGRLW